MSMAICFCMGFGIKILDPSKTNFSLSLSIQGYHLMSVSSCYMKVMATYNAFKGLLSFHLIWKAFPLKITDGSHDHNILWSPPFCWYWSFAPAGPITHSAWPSMFHRPISSIAHRHWATILNLAYELPSICSSPWNMCCRIDCMPAECVKRSRPMCCQLAWVLLNKVFCAVYANAMETCSIFNISKKVIALHRLIALHKDI